MNIELGNTNFVNFLTEKAYDSKEIKHLPTEILRIIFDVLADLGGLSDLQALSMVNKDMYSVAKTSRNPKVQCIFNRQFLEYWIKGSGIFKESTLCTCKARKPTVVKSPLVLENSDCTEGSYSVIQRVKKSDRIEVAKSLRAWKLLGGKEINPNDCYSDAITWLAMSGHTKLLELLLAWSGPNGERVDPIACGSGVTLSGNDAILLAAANGHVEVVELLLAWSGPNGERVDPTACGNYAILRAAAGGHAKVVDLLLAWTGPNGECIAPTAWSNYEIARAALSAGAEVICSLLGWDSPADQKL